MSRKCGAKTRNGAPCQRPPLAGKTRCRLHGGLSPGAPKGNRNAATPGSIHSKFLTPREEALLPMVQVGSLDDEIRLTRILLRRALARESAHRFNAERVRFEIEAQQQRIKELEARRTDLLAKLERQRAFQTMLSTKHRRVCLCGLRYTTGLQEQPHEEGRCNDNAADDGVQFQRLTGPHAGP